MTSSEHLKPESQVSCERAQNVFVRHSAGAVQALYLSLLESEYFAATAVHAGALDLGAGQFMDRAQRKIPIAIFVGTNDQFNRSVWEFLKRHELSADPKYEQYQFKQMIIPAKQK